MRQYTTPTLRFAIKGFDITSCNVYVSLSQDAHTLTMVPSRMSYEDDVTSIEIDLSQAETAGFNKLSKLFAQVNWIDENGKRNATEIKSIPVQRNLLGKEIAYGTN